MVNQIVIAIGAMFIVWGYFGWKRGCSPGVAAGVAGWLYSDVAGLCIAISLAVSFIAKLRTVPAASRQNKNHDVIDAEYEVRYGN